MVALRAQLHLQQVPAILPGDAVDLGVGAWVRPTHGMTVSAEWWQCCKACRWATCSLSVPEVLELQVQKQT
jgi:hypothetical protein